MSTGSSSGHPGIVRNVTRGMRPRHTPVISSSLNSFWQPTCRLQATLVSWANVSTQFNANSLLRSLITTAMHERR